MAALTEAGFLEQPHTSAGRVPTDRAYRLFLESAEAGAPSIGEQEKISRRLAKAGSPEAALTALASQLAEISGAAAVYASSRGVQHFQLSNVFGQPELTHPQVARYLAELLDQAAEWLPKLAAEPGKLAVRIGQENRDYRAQQVSVLALRTDVTGEPAYLAVIGPTRLPYRKVMSLFDFGNSELERLYGKS